MKLYILLVLLFFVVSCTSKSGKDLIHAVKDNNLERVRNLVTQENVNSTDEMNATPVMWAAFVGNVEIIKLLIEKGADVKKKGIIGVDADKEPSVYTNVLIAVAGEGHLDAVKYLVEKVGLSPDVKGDCPRLFLVLPDQIKKTDGITEYIKNSKGKVFDLFRKHGSYTLFFVSPKKAYPFIFSLIINDLIMEEDLVNEVLDENAFRRMAENRKEVEKIFKSFINPLNDYSYIEESNSGTALLAASFKGYDDIVSFLISKGADVNSKDCHGVSPVFTASISQELNVINTLLKNGADGNVKIDYFKNNEVYAIEHLFMGGCETLTSREYKEGLKKILPMILRNKPAEKSLSSPMHTACKCKDKELVKMFVDNGADYEKIKYDVKSLKDICKENGIDVGEQQ